LEGSLSVLRQRTENAALIAKPGELAQVDPPRRKSMGDILDIDDIHVGFSLRPS
jgi:hypothetical protein